MPSNNIPSQCSHVDVNSSLGFPREIHSESLSIGLESNCQESLLSVQSIQTKQESEKKKKKTDSKELEHPSLKNKTRDICRSSCLRRSRYIICFSRQDSDKTQLCKLSTKKLQTNHTILNYLQKNFCFHI